MSGRTVPKLSPNDTAGVLGDVVLPLAARGAIVRRPRVENLLDRLDGDRRAVRRMQRLRDTHGAGPVRLALPGRELALVLEPHDVQRVLLGSPDPFALATREKRAALAKFQPHGVLITAGPERGERRRFNQAVLDTRRPVHHLAEAFAAKVREEAAPLVERAELGWDAFAPAWWRIVRRVVLGDGARDDEEVTDLLRRLRRDANWSYVLPPRKGLRARFLQRLGAHLDRAEEGSLAALVRGLPSSPATVPDEQVPQWLFAFDAAGMAAFRALALVSAHGGDVAEEAFRRATLLESVRLWPTTPAILRDTTRETEWESGTLRPGTGLIVFAPFFHRDDTRLEHADRFAPELWTIPKTGEGSDPSPNLGMALVPFSAGSGECPGRNLVLFLTGTLLATLLERHDLRSDALDATQPMPATLSPFRLRFAVAPRA